MIKRMYDYKKVKHPFCHFIQHGGCFVRATSESLASIGFIYTFASEKTMRHSFVLSWNLKQSNCYEEENNE